MVEAKRIEAPSDIPAEGSYVLVLYGPWGEYPTKRQRRPPKPARRTVRVMSSVLKWAAPTFQGSGSPRLPGELKLAERATRFLAPAQPSRILDPGPSESYRHFLQ